MKTYVVLYVSTKEKKEYVMDEDEYSIFKKLPYKRAMNYLKVKDKQPTETKQQEQSQ